MKILGNICLFIGVMWGAAVHADGHYTASQNQIAQIIGNQRILIIASRQTEAETIQYVNDFYGNSPMARDQLAIDVFLSSNTWFAITLGYMMPATCEAVAEDLKRQNLIPQDSFCGSGKKFIAAFQPTQTSLVPIIGENYFAGSAPVQPAQTTPSISANDLRIRSAELDARENEIDAWEREVDRFAKSLSSKEQELIRKEQQLNRRERELNAQIAAFEARKSQDTDGYAEFQTLLEKTKWSITQTDVCYSDSGSYQRIAPSGFEIVVASGTPTRFTGNKIKSFRFNSATEFVAEFEERGKFNQWPEYPDIKLRFEGKLLTNGQLELTQISQTKNILKSEMEYMTRKSTEKLAPCTTAPQKAKATSPVSFTMVRLPSDISTSAIPKDCAGLGDYLSNNTKDMFLSFYSAGNARGTINFEPSVKGCMNDKARRDLGVCNAMESEFEYSLNGSEVTVRTDGDNCVIKNQLRNALGVQTSIETTTSGCTLGASRKEVTYIVCSAFR